MKKLLFLSLLLAAANSLYAQIRQDDMGYNSIDANGDITNQKNRRHNADSLGTDKEIPEGIYTWTIDRRFGDRTPAKPDTLQHMFMNSIFTTGLRGEYNTTGNLGSPRQARIFIDRKEDEKFIFANPYDFVITPIEQFHFTNTLSPFTNLSYNNCGNRINGEDHFKALFGVNVGKKLGVGFKFDYLYGRGYYDSQSTSHINYTMYGSYLGDRYQAHLLLTTLHQKVTENGGITNDAYITHPESFNENFATSEIPTMLTRNWNRNDSRSIFFTQRYNLGFNRKVPMTPEEIKARKFAIAAKKEKEEREAKEKAMKDAGEDMDKVDLDKVTVPAKYAGRPDDAKIGVKAEPNDSAKNNLQHSNDRIRINSKEAADSLLATQAKTKTDTSWLKNEYVPVTSFIHTLNFKNYRRIFEAYNVPENYYLYTYNAMERLRGDSIYDSTMNWSLNNTFAISLLEGFNKWVKTGAKIFASYNLDHYTLPGLNGRNIWNEHSVVIGAQLSKTQGKTLHYNATGDFATAGYNIGEIHVDGGIDVNFPLFRDTMTLAASGFFHHEKPDFYYRHYHGKHLWWDNNDLSMVDHFRVQGVLNYQKTRTRLRVAFDEIKNYTYFSTWYTTTQNARLQNVVQVNQQASPITIITAEVTQDCTFGPLNWETVLTFQKSTSNNALPLPALNVYTNLYLKFKIARVLNCHFGVDARYFTEYDAPEYVAPIGQYAIQGNSSKVKIGNYPIVNAYFNFKLKKARFFAMMSHINSGMGNKRYFLTPHYPLNERIFRLGVSWTFAN